jgi:hypothetical protein
MTGFKSKKLEILGLGLFLFGISFTIYWSYIFVLYYLSSNFFFLFAGVIAGITLELSGLIILTYAKLPNYREFNYNYSYDKMFNLSTDSIKESGFSIKEVDRVNGLIIAKSGLTWKSYGEKIRVYFKDTGEGTQIKMTSKAYQLFDWGKNEDNINKFFYILNYKLLTEFMGIEQKKAVV